METITLTQLNQALASAMGAFPTVTCAVTLCYTSMYLTTGKVAIPRVCSSELRPDGMTDLVAYVTLLQGAASIMVDLTNMGVAILGVPQQPVQVAFVGGFIECNRKGGVTLSTTQHLRHVELVRANINDVSTEVIVPFFLRVGKRQVHSDNLLADATLFAKIAPSGVPPDLNSVDDVTDHVFYDGMTPESKCYQMKVYDGVEMYSVQLNTGTQHRVNAGMQHAKLRVDGAMMWRVANVKMYGQTIVTLPLYGSDPSIVVSEIRVLPGTKVVRFIIMV